MPELATAWASGLSTPTLQFQDRKTVVGVAGQNLKFVPATSLSSEESLKLYPGKSEAQLRRRVRNGAGGVGFEEGTGG